MSHYNYNKERFKSVFAGKNKCPHLMNIKFPDLTYIVVNISWYLLHDFSEWDVFVPLFGGKCGQGGGGNSSPYYPPTQVHSNFTLFGGMCGQGGGVSI